MSRGRPVRLALIGCGWIAGNRLRQVADDDLARIVAVVDPDPRACAALCERVPEARVVDDLRTLGRADVDAVMISSPSGLHAGQAVALLNQGLPVFVQKPLGICGREVDDVLATASAADLPVATDLCYRDLSSAIALREALIGGAMGRPFHIEACFHNAYRPNAGWSDQLGVAGGGALIDLGIHLVDLVLWLTGLDATLRGVHLRRRGELLEAGAVEDFAALDLALADTTTVRVTTSWDASTGMDAQISLRIHTTNGSLELVNREGSFFHFDARRCFGTSVEHLAADDTDRWQAGPLLRWLRQVRAGEGFREPAWLRATTAVIDQAYAQGRPAAGTPLMSGPLIPETGVVA